MYVSIFRRIKININFLRYIFLYFILFGFYGCNSEDIFSDDINKDKQNQRLVSIQILPVKNLTLGVSDLQIVKGSYQAFVAIGFYSDDSSENISDKVSWSSTFSEIATITEIGIAKGVDVGITSIKAIKDGVISNELSLTVTAAALENIQLIPAIVSLAKGSSQQYTAVGFYSDDTSRELTQEVSWRSSNTSIVTISEMGHAVGVDVGSSTISAVKDGVVSNDGRLTVTVAVLESIQITPAIVSLAKGSSQQYTAVGFYSDDTSRELTQEVSWRSSNTSIVTISEIGHAVGVDVGNSTISAVKDGVVSNDGRLTVTVAVLESIQITPAIVSLAKGSSQQYTAVGFYSDDTSRELTQEVSWRSSNTSIVTISEIGHAVGVDVGNSTITAVKDGVVSNDGRLTVTVAVLESIQLTPAIVSLVKGSSQQYTAVGFYSDDTSRELTQEVSWRSSNTSIVTISEMGHAVGVDVGNSTITAVKDGVVSNDGRLTVTVAVLESIQLTPAIVSLAKGSSQQYTAVGFYSDDTSRELTQEVSWRSSNTSIVTISEIGHAVGVDVGNSTITAVKDGVVSNDGRLTVTVAVLESIQITPAIVSLAKGSSQQYTAVGFYSDDTSRELTQEVSWRSSNTSIVTISEMGHAVGVDVGSSTISAVKDGVVSNDGRLTVTVAVLESIQITPAIVSLAKGSSQQYTAVGFYSDDTSRELTQEVSWRSSNTSIVTISEIGHAVGVDVGNSTITAVKEGVVSNDGMLTIVIEDISFHLNVTPKNTFIPFVGGRQQFKAELVYNDGRIEDVTPSVIWQSSATDVAVIDQAGIATSVSLLENATRIQAILKSNTNIWAETLLHVSKSRPISISINIVDGTQVLNVGEQQKYILIGIFDIVGGRFFDLSYSAEWVSSDTSVIQMNGPVANAVGSGKATITVRYQDERENTLQLTVR